MYSSCLKNNVSFKKYRMKIGKFTVFCLCAVIKCIKKHQEHDIFFNIVKMMNQHFFVSQGEWLCPTNIFKSQGLILWIFWHNRVKIQNLIQIKKIFFENADFALFFQLCIFFLYFQSTFPVISRDFLIFHHQKYSKLKKKVPSTGWKQVMRVQPNSFFVIC